jgi:hypothetical protein
MDLLRHGRMDRLFTGVRALSTLGAFLRTFIAGHVRQLDAVAARSLAALARNAPILPGADQGWSRLRADSAFFAHNVGGVQTRSLTGGLP